MDHVATRYGHLVSLECASHSRSDAQFHQGSAFFASPLSLFERGGRGFASLEGLDSRKMFQKGSNLEFTPHGSSDREGLSYKLKVRGGKDAKLSLVYRHD